MFSRCDPEFKKGPVLYNLKDDIGETTNIAQKEPTQVAKMLARLKVRPDPAGPPPPSIHAARKIYLAKRNPSPSWPCRGYIDM